MDVYRQISQLINLVLYQAAWQYKAGDAPGGDPAQTLCFFIDGHIKAGHRQGQGAGQPRRAAAHHRHRLPLGLRRGPEQAVVGAIPVSYKPLQPADRHRLTLDAPGAVALALLLTGAHPPGDLHHGIGPAQQLPGRLEPARPDLRDKLWDVGVGGTVGGTIAIRAVEAPLRLGHGLFRRVAQRDLVEIAQPLRHGLFRHRGLAGGHIGLSLLCHDCTSISCTAWTADR